MRVLTAMAVDEFGGRESRERSFMQNRIDIDRAHSRAICQEIGERLQLYLREQPEPSASLRRKIDRLRELDGRSPSIAASSQRQR